MRTYLKSHLSLIASAGCVVFLLVTIIWLDNYRNVFLIGYALLLIFLLVICSLSVNYVNNRTFYRYLDKGIKVGESNGYLSKKWQKRYEEQNLAYQKRIVELEQQHQQRIKFMNIWIHQMKTPVAVLELMAESEATDTEDILAETERLTNGLSTALTYTRLDYFQEDFIIERSSLRSIVQQSVNEQKRNFIRSRVYPEFVNQADFSVATDNKWLRLLIFQLLSNAIKYSKPETIVALTINEERRTLTIQDQGCGIAEADLPRICRPFFTGDNGRKTAEATGMGLYLVDMISKNLAIDVSFQSEIGKGTSVIVTFKKE